jgi:hypothetical protein
LKNLPVKCQRRNKQFKLENGANDGRKPPKHDEDGRVKRSGRINPLVDTKSDGFQK